jgi:hypothetical protein
VTIPALISTDDNAIINHAASIGEDYAASELGKASDLWAQIEAKAAEGAGVAAGVTATVVGGIALLNALGATALSTFLTALVSQILVDVGLVAAGTVATGAAVGSVIPGIGTVVGLVIGAIVAAFQVIGYSCSVQITNGSRYNCGDYVKNLQAMSDWLKSGGNVVGATPLWAANQFGLFLANPLWMYANQKQLGISQPPPPDPTSDTGKLYELPGAFEMLNKPQLLAATQLVTGTPSRLSTWSTVLSSAPVVPNPDQSWNEVTVSDPSWLPGDQGYKYGSSVYQAPPGLFQGDTKNLGGVFPLQIVFPALTKAQCQKIFARTQPAYDDVIARATAYIQDFAANRWDHYPPDPSMLGAGSEWNLSDADIQRLTGPLLATANAQDAANSANSAAANVAAWQAVFGTPPAAPVHITLPGTSYIGSTGPGKLAPGPAPSFTGGLDFSHGVIVTGGPMGDHLVSGGGGVPVPLTLGQAQAIMSGQVPGVMGYVAGVARSAASGHPAGVLAAEVLSLAQRLQIQAKFVARYVGAAEAKLILSGLALTHAYPKRQAAIVHPQTTFGIAHPAPALVRAAMPAPATPSKYSTLLHRKT